MKPILILATSISAITSITTFAAEKPAPQKPEALPETVVNAK